MKTLKKSLSLFLALLLILSVFFAFPLSAEAKGTKYILQKQQYNCVHGTGFNFDKKHFVYSKNGAIYLSSSPYNKGRKIIKNVPSTVFSLQIYKNQIFYVDPERALIQKYDIKTKATETVVELNNSLNDIEGYMRGSLSCRMFVYKGIVYYNLLGNLCAVTVNGDYVKNIDGGVDPYFYIYKNVLYYIKNNNRLRTYNPKTKKKKTVKKFRSEVWMPSLEGNKAYIMKWGEANENYKQTYFYKLNLKNRKMKFICKSRIKYNESNYILLGHIVKNGKMYITTDINNNDRFAGINHKNGSLNYKKYDSKYKYIGGYYTKIAMGYYKNSIFASEYKTRKNSEKNKIQKFIKLA